MDTLRALEEGLLNFPGCAVVITLDRWFLDRIATHILAFEGDSHVEWFLTVRTGEGTKPTCRMAFVRGDCLRSHSARAQLRFSIDASSYL